VRRLATVGLAATLVVAGAALVVTGATSVGPYRVAEHPATHRPVSTAVGGGGRPPRSAVPVAKGPVSRGPVGTRLVGKGPVGTRLVGKRPVGTRLVAKEPVSSRRRRRSGPSTAVARLGRPPRRATGTGRSRPPNTTNAQPAGAGHRVSPGRFTGTAPVISDIGPTGSFLVIPSLGVKAPLVPTGAAGAPETASLTIPSDIHTVGWWDGTVSDGESTIQEDAPRPGQPGVALIAGHIDSAVAGPGALYNLGDLTPGDAIEITGSQGRSTDWVVSAPPQTTLKTELPSSLWVTTGAPKLALVTCGGPFDSATGHYLDNVIVWATPASP
jgi:Sortase domain